MRTEDTELLTVGQLLEELAEFEEDYYDYDVVCWTPDREPCFPTSVELDGEGDLCISLKEDDGENYSVGMLLEELDKYDPDTRVYVAARGLFLNIEVKNDNTIFYEDLDEESDIEVVASDGIIFGKYEDESSDYEDDDCQEVEEEESELEEKAENNNSATMKIVLALALLLCAYGTYYNISAIIHNSNNDGIYKNVISVILCLFLLAIGIKSFLPSKKNNLKK